jgi:hypothetical protein
MGSWDGIDVVLHHQGMRLTRSPIAVKLDLKKMIDRGVEIKRKPGRSRNSEASIQIKTSTTIQK